MHTSASLNTNSIWQNTIGHDPYAAEGEPSGGGSQAGESGYDQFKGLLKLASAQYGTEERGVWKGKKPLKGVFAMPQFGHSEGIKMESVREGGGGGRALSSSDSSDSDSDDSDDSDDEDIVAKMSARMREGGVMGFGSQKLDKDGKPQSKKRERDDEESAEEEKRAKKARKKEKKAEKKREKKERKRRKKEKKREKKEKKSKKKSKKKEKKERR